MTANSTLYIVLMTKLIVVFRNFANAPKSRRDERRTCLKNVLVNPIPTVQIFVRCWWKCDKGILT